MDGEQCGNISEADMPTDKDITLKGERKARGNLADLKQWSAKQMPHPTKADLDALHGHDPKRVLFMSFDRNSTIDYPYPFTLPLYERVGLKTFSGYKPHEGKEPTIYHLNSAKEGTHDERVIHQTIEAHIRKYGTIDELVISGHGERNKIGTTAPIEAWGLLQELVFQQKKLGFQPVKRIVFDGCDVFGDLRPNEVRRYKELAKALGAEVVGPTTGVLGPTGRFVQFTPEGTVKRDRLDSPFLVWVQRMIGSIRGESALANEEVTNQIKNEAWLKKELNGGRKSAAPKVAGPLHT